MDCSNGSALAQLARHSQTKQFREQSSHRTNTSTQLGLNNFLPDPLQSHLNLNKIPQLNHSNWTNEFPHMDVHLDNNSQSRFENSFTKMRVNNPEQIDQQQSNSWSVDFSSQNNMIMDRQQPHDINIGFQRIQNNQPFQPRQNVNENLCWSKAFEEVQEQQRLIINAPDCSTALSESAGLLLKTVQDSDNPKFKDSKFLDLMKQFRDGEAAIEGDKVVEQISKNKNVVQDQNERWSDEYTGPLHDWAHKNEFNSDTTGDKSFPHDWAAEFKDKMEINSADDPDTMWENLEKQWTQDQQAYSHGADARFSQYTFTSDNPYATFPQDFLSDVTKHKNLTESVLALEAAVKTDPTSDKWLELGRKQQENENDFAAISAFRKSLELNSGNLEALMSLSVSYTNENYASEAYDTLQLWIERHPKYANLAPIGVIPMSQKHQVISQAFTRAAVSSPGADLDENVQTALGILFNISTEYHKAVDCFRAALSKRPNDYELWNKLGATFANSNDASKAIEAYFTALEIKPDYIRARYNLSIACIQTGQYSEAAEHLLGALSIQQNDLLQIAQTTGKENVVIHIGDGQSANVWQTLRLLMDTYIRRNDLVEACDAKDLDAFRNDFDF